MNRTIALIVVAGLIADDSVAECMITAMLTGAGPPTYNILSCQSAQSYIDGKEWYRKYGPPRDLSFSTSGSAIRVSKEYRSASGPFYKSAIEPFEEIYYFSGECIDLALNRDSNISVKYLGCCEFMTEPRLDCFFENEAIKIDVQ
jgi:hypothetical protein